MLLFLPFKLIQKLKRINVKVKKKLSPLSANKWTKGTNENVPGIAPQA